MDKISIEPSLEGKKECVKIRSIIELASITHCHRHQFVGDFVFDIEKEAFLQNQFFVGHRRNAPAELGDFLLKFV